MGDLQPRLRAFDGLPKIDVESVLQIGTFLRTLLRLLVRAPKPMAENILKIGRFAGTARSSACIGMGSGTGTASRPAGELGEIEAAEAHVGAVRSGPGSRARRSVFRIEAHLIVHLLLLRVA